jgi:hypothetical protein
MIAEDPRRTTPASCCSIALVSSSPAHPEGAVVGSFFPSSAAVNPVLTTIANALRVGEHIAQRLK